MAIALNKTKLLKLGQINFINCLPLNYQSLDLFKGVFELEIYQASPRELNSRLYSGELDLAPISSYEYLLHQDSYELIEGISISSKAQADSVLLFVKGKLEDAKTIYVTNQSASSVNLLKIVLVKKYKLKLEELEFISFDQRDESMEVKLLIGDQALAQFEARSSKLEGEISVVDLGLEWYELTGLPMVFGLWVMNRSSDLLEYKSQISKALIAKRNESLGDKFPDLIIEAYRQTGLSKVILKQYFENLDYDFTDRHKVSLDLFASYLRELNLLC